MPFLTKEDKKKYIEDLKANLTGISFSSVNSGYIDDKIQEFKESVNKQIDSVSQNVSDLIYDHGNATLNNATILIYANGNATLNQANRVITESINNKTSEIMQTISEEFEFTQDQVNLLKDSIINNTFKAVVNGGKDITSNSVSAVVNGGNDLDPCLSMKSLKEVANLDHQAHLTGCNQPSESFPVYEVLNSKIGIVAYLANDVKCTGLVDGFNFSINDAGECYVLEE